MSHDGLNATSKAEKKIMGGNAKALILLAQWHMYNDTRPGSDICFKK